MEKNQVPVIGEHRKARAFACSVKQWFWCVSQLSVWKRQMKESKRRKEKPRVEQVHSAMNLFGTQSNEECWWGIQAGGVSWAKSGVWDSAGSFLLASHSLSPHSELTQNIPFRQTAVEAEWLQDVKMYSVEILGLKKVMTIHFQHAHKSLSIGRLLWVYLLFFLVFSWILETAASSSNQTAFYHWEHRRKCVFC